jgi:hypothetical protein
MKYSLLVECYKKILKQWETLRLCLIENTNAEFVLVEILRRN